MHHYIFTSLISQLHISGGCRTLRMFQMQCNTAEDCNTSLSRDGTFHSTRRSGPCAAIVRNGHFLAPGAGTMVFLLFLDFFHRRAYSTANRTGSFKESLKLFSFRNY